MKICYNSLVQLLVLFFVAVNADHHTHEHNHQDLSSHSDVLSAYDHHFHEYHHHHPVEQPNCGQICPKSLSKFGQFEMGQVYTIDIDGQTFINVKEGQTISLKGKLDVHVLSPCEFALKLKDSQVMGVPNPQELGQQLDNSPILRFGAHDGKVMGVCAAPEEEIWTLNVKKAILSAIQVTTKDLTQTQTVEEVDFSGHCTTTYRPLSSDDSILLEKTKNLNKCHLRRKSISGFNSKSLSMLTEFLREHLPILKANQRCLQDIRNGHLFSVRCTEEQTLSFQDEPIVKSTLNLKFVGKAPASGSPAGAVLKNAQTLLMSRDNEGEKVAIESEVLAGLKDMCAEVSGDRMSPRVTELFHSLVTALKTLPEEGTRNLEKGIKSGEICDAKKLRNLFISASAFAASEPSVQTLINAFNDKEISQTQMSLLMALVAVKTRPTEKTIEKIAALVESEQSSRSLTLGVSIMVRNFCKKTENCENSPAVKKTTSALIQKLQNTDNNIERITAIKALDNIRAKTDETVKSALLQWAQKSDADIGVRVAAIQGLIRIADDNIREKLMEVLTKDSEPSEVRINAYKAIVMSGASAGQLENIKSVTDFQIQNYIRTHIKSLKKSVIQSRRALIPENAPQFEDPKSTALGVSRNMELSIKSAALEVDLIHPKGSFVPSLETFGLYVPVGGKDYQLMEIQLRQQGFDEHIKRLISKGIGGAEMLMQLSEEVLELMAHLKDPNHKHNTIFQISVRMSGKNILFIDTFEDLHNFVVMMKEKVKQLMNTDSVDMARAAIPLDSQVEVPTINGFPMLLHLDEVIVLGYKAVSSWSEKGTSKVRNVKSTLPYMEKISAGLKLKVKDYRPGFEWQMLFEMERTRDVQLETIDGRVLKARINLPKDRKTVMKLTQNTQLIDANGVPKVNSLGKRSADENTQCREVFGLNVCRSRTEVENSPIPNVEYYVERVDPNLDYIEMTLEKPGVRATRDLLVWTAKVNAGQREYLAQLEIQNPTTGAKKANMKLVSPRRTITADASLVNSADGNTSKMEVDFKLPKVIDINTKYSVQKKGAYDKDVDVVVEYLCGESGKKETLKWNRKSSFQYRKDKKAKVFSADVSGELQSTQFPKYNSKFSYYVNYKPYQQTKTEMTLQWGPELNDKLALSYLGKTDVIELTPFQMVSDHDLTIVVTPKDINYNIKLNTEISMTKGKPKIINLDLVGKDVNGRPNKDMKGSVKYERMDQPIQQTVNASLSYPGRDLTYYSEVKQIKDLTFAGKTIISPQKGKVLTIDHKSSITNPTKAFHLESEADVICSWKEGKISTKLEVGWESADKFEFDVSSELDGQKHRKYEFTYDKKTGELKGEAMCKEHDKEGEFMIDNIYNPKSAKWGLKSGAKSYKFSATRVPKETYTLNLDSAENSRLKEMKIKVSRKEKSTFKMVLNDGTDINSYIDLFSKDKRAHLDFKCPKHNMEHTGDIILNKAERKITWDSKTLVNGKPFITIDAMLTPNKRSQFIMKKIKGPDAVSKMELFVDKGAYGAVIDTSKFSAVLEGENRDNKRFGKIGFVDKVDNYEHKSHFNITNGVLTIKSVSDSGKETFTKFDAIIGARIVSDVKLITPKINGHLVINPLAEKKTLVLKYVSPNYDQNTNVEWIRKKYMKIESVSQRKVEPQKTVKFDAYLTREDEATIKVTAPALDIDIKRVKTPKPHFVFNTTINGYNEISEYESNPNLSPSQNLFIAIRKFLQDYFSNN